ncbi:MAG: hypothetical protein ACYC61_25805 [Isosphaeraceae bacterium]
MEKLAVDRPRSHFTLRQMMGVVALCALLLALARLSPIWPWTFTVFGLPAVGYAMDRALGGRGIRGAKVAGAVVFPAFPLLGLLQRPSVNSGDVFSLIPIATVISTVGLVWGGMLGRWIRLAEEIRDAARAPAVVARSSGWTTRVSRGSSPAAGSVPGRTGSPGPVVDEDGTKEISWREGGSS